MDIRWLIGAVALAAAVLTLRELPGVIRRRRRWLDIDALSVFSVRGLAALPDEPMPGEVVVAGLPLSPGAPGSPTAGEDFYLQDPTDPDARALVVASEAPLIEHPDPDPDEEASQAGDAGLDRRGTPIYMVGVIRRRADGGGVPSGLQNGSSEGGPVVSAELASGAGLRPWRVEPTRGPGGRQEFTVFRSPDVPGREAQRALVTLMAAGGVIGFALYVFLRVAWSSLGCSCLGF